jgi:Putative phage tail protein
VGIEVVLISAAVSIGLRLFASSLQKRERTDFKQQLPDSQYRLAIPKIYNGYRVKANFIEPYGEDEAFDVRRKNDREILEGTFLAVLSNSETKLEYYYLNGKGRDVLKDVTYLSGSSEQEAWSKGNLPFANQEYFKTLKIETGRDYDLQSKVGYRTLSCIGFSKLNLSDDLKINTFPSLDVVHSTLKNYKVAEIVADICQDAGIGPQERDVSEILDLRDIRGFERPQNGSTYAEELAPLGLAYQFFVTETTAGKLSFRKYERPGVKLVIPWQDLIVLENGVLWNQTSNDKIDLPRTVSINYIDPSKDWQQQAIISDEYLEAQSQNQDSIELPIAMSSGRAKMIANWQLEQTWMRSSVFTFKLGLKYLTLFEVGDVLALPGNFQVQVESFDVGAGYTIEVSAVSYDSKDNSSILDLPDSEPTTQPSPRIIVNPNFNSDGITVNYGTLKLLDLPLADPSHGELGFYCFSDRSGSSLILNRGDGERLEKTFVQASTFGVCNTVLGVLPNTNLTSEDLPIIDPDSLLEVTLASGSLNAEITDLSFDNQEQIAFVGKLVAGEWVGEYIGFQYADALGANRYRLQLLARGLRGTEAFIDRHTAGEEFFLLLGDRSYWERVNVTEQQIGQQWIGKLQVVNNQDLSITPAITMTIKGKAIAPLPPLDLTIVEDPEENLVFDFNPRSRGANRILGETAAVYNLELLNNSGAVVRVLSGSKPLIYPQAQKVLDGLPLNAIDANLYKVSSLYGRGLPALIRDFPVMGDTTPTIVNTSSVNKGFRLVTASRNAVIEDDDHWVLVDTNLADVTFTLVDLPPVNFYLQNIGTKLVQLAGNLIAPDTVLRSKESMSLVNRNSVWHGHLSGRQETSDTLTIDDSITLSQIHHGKTLNVVGEYTVPITLDESLLSNPLEFETTVRLKSSDASVVFLLANSASQLPNVSHLLTVKYSSMYLAYEGNGIWFGKIVD